MLKSYLTYHRESKNCEVYILIFQIYPHSPFLPVSNILALSVGWFFNTGYTYESMSAECSLFFLGSSDVAYDLFLQLTQIPHSVENCHLIQLSYIDFLNLESFKIILDFLIR